MYKKTTVFSIACAGMLLFGITLITLGAVLPELKDKFGFDEMDSGALFAILPFGILAGSLIFGYFCDRYGYKWILMICCAMIALGLAGIASLKSAGLLKIGIFFLGMGGGCVNGATNALVADLSPVNKTANLSLLGVFFAIGALGVPLLLGMVKDVVSFEIVLFIVAAFSLVLVLTIFFVRFPPAKHNEKINPAYLLQLFRNRTLLLIAFFLFFQSSLEAVIHNWIASYLIEDLSVAKDKALYALTLNVLGMAIMRLLIGSLFRNASERILLWASLGVMFASGMLLYFADSFSTAAIALFLIGAGLAAGFPLMYAIAGKSFPNVSATAFSFILTIALMGNMLINYLAGIITKYYGIGRIISLLLIEVIAMGVLYGFITKEAQDKIN